ncbi:Pre-mRNA-processing factor 40-like protein [Smittium mucronatum]|uniref:Pre-mRNA-processing factor 40-like protein n=1 Tax=Smittium mucronatum TaxID=133383 RepID=A0A1R0H3C1_9FUNG|nr:Pre-mRNA-processing factor 40-like protein [Smittium mucronatum]
MEDKDDIFDMETLSIKNITEILKNSKDSSTDGINPITQSNENQHETLLASLPKLESLSTKKESEDAFKLLLSFNKIDPETTWDSAMRTIIEHPLYNCLDSVSERKRIFFQYCQEKKEENAEKDRANKRKIRQDFFKVLDSLPLTEFSRFKKAELLAKNNPTYQAITDINERQSLFERYMDCYMDILTDLRTERHKYYAKELSKVLDSLDDLAVQSKWLETKKILMNHPRVIQLIEESNSNQLIGEHQYLKILQDIYSKSGESKDYTYGGVCKRNIELNDRLEPIDILESFQIKSLDMEQKYMDKLENERKLRDRAERKHREAFKELLNEHLFSAVITPVSLWQEFYPLIKDDVRYINMLGQFGSTPLDLFWDQVEDLNDKVYAQRKIIEDHLRQQLSFQKELQKNGKEYNSAVFKITPLTRLSELEEYLKSPTFINSPQGNSKFDIYTLPYIHEQLIIKARRREEEETKRMQRHKRKALEYLVYTMNNKFDPPLHMDSKWEEEKQRILSIPKFPTQYISQQECEALFDSIIEKIRSQATNAPPEPGEYISSSNRKNASRSSSIDSLCSNTERRSGVVGNYGDPSYSKKKSRHAY